MLKNRQTQNDKYPTDALLSLLNQRERHFGSLPLRDHGIASNVMSHDELLERMKLWVSRLPAEVRETLQDVWNGQLPQVTSNEAQINKVQRILGEIGQALTAVGGLHHYYRLSLIPAAELDLVILEQFARDYRSEMGLDRTGGPGTATVQANLLATTWLEGSTPAVAAA